ncbi:formyltetrahydrofolate deformylase [Alicyclobacillus dauci]|uniref:Formyltetrahydrofolate deformylase n=1 Tax=Alicyclobacillus dauci TaxID=1475485 RepID=A0ABY6Z4K6_9BACL|nr:formyltetrahydrofolate deformylase [Alicyclobacillus dauci]WAH37823.1 formyltetrahydrofolate deformylase [Alicyclobacillus dauci]
MIHENRGRLLIACPDRRGIVASVAQFLYDREANIAASDQYSTDVEGGTLFMRIEFDRDGLVTYEEQLCSEFSQLAKSYEMEWRYAPARQRKRVAVFVSKELHCLQELLWEWQSGQLECDIAMVVSNHRDAEPLVQSLGIPFHYIPVDPADKTRAEREQLQLLEGNVDLVVLARYMQILSGAFLAHYRERVINIHHSFLPAFIGRNPYQRAYDRGVKLIGATAHYVTEDLDEGPIIEQDVTRVDHRYNASALRIAGRQVERAVLARAVKWHLEDKVIVHGNKTIVFA